MHTSHTFGTATSLRPTGFGRYVTAAFLGVWLTGWAIGEFVAGTALVTILVSLAGVSIEQLPTWGEDMLKSGGLALAILFLGLWLTLWTIGGIAALTEFMRSLAGEDSIAVTPLGLELVRRAGPFRRRHSFDRSAIRGIRLRPRDRALVVDSEKGTRVLTTFGSPLEREQMLSWLKQYLHLPDGASAGTGMPPTTWDVIDDAGTARVRKVKPRARIIRSIISWVVTAVAGMGWISSFDGELTANVILFAITMALACGAVASTWGRREWTVRRGEMIFRRSILTWTSEQAFRDARLEIKHSTDSDNDSHYTLNVVYGDAQRSVHSQMNDSREVDDLAHWLANRTGFPLTS